MKKILVFSLVVVALLGGVFVVRGMSSKEKVVAGDEVRINSTPTPTAEKLSPPENVNIPILMYHTSSVEEPKSNLKELYVKPAEFENQIEYLKDNGYTFVTFDDWNRLNNIKKPVMLTFDDGYLENYTQIFPILKKHDAKITLFLTVNHMDIDDGVTYKGDGFSSKMVKEMSDSGLVKFEGHTITHPSLVQIAGNNGRIEQELGTAKRKIEEITGKDVLAIAYPNGEYNEAVIKKAKEYYKFGLRKDGGLHNTNYSDFEIRRSRVNRSTTLESFKSLVAL